MFEHVDGGEADSLCKQVYWAHTTHSAGKLQTSFPFSEANQASGFYTLHAFKTIIFVIF